MLERVSGTPVLMTASTDANVPVSLVGAAEL